MLSHGFIPNSVDKKDIEFILDKIKVKFSNKIKQQITYFDGLHKELPVVKKLINEKLKLKIKKYLLTENIILRQVELHILLPQGDAIPPHQDNFYHCVEPNKSLKILVPLNHLNENSGGLGYLNCDNKFKTLKHNASKVKNFSAFIKKEEFNKLNYQSCFYEYNIGDISYHFVSSIHFSNGNKTNKFKFFLVYRFESLDTSISNDAIKLYEETRTLHLKNLKKDLKPFK